MELYSYEVLLHNQYNNNLLELVIVVILKGLVRFGWN